MRWIERVAAWTEAAYSGYPIQNGLQAVNESPSQWLSAEIALFRHFH